jgi:hypothetical protein
MSGYEWKDIEEGRVKVKTFKSWAEWKAHMLNQLFKEQGLTGQEGRITAATVRHGETIRRWKPQIIIDRRTLERGEDDEIHE